MMFVCFAHVCFCPFSLPLGVEGWLRFVISLKIDFREKQEYPHLDSYCSFKYTNCQIPMHA